MMITIITVILAAALVLVIALFMFMLIVSASLLDDQMDEMHRQKEDEAQLEWIAEYNRRSGK